MNLEKLFQMQTVLDEHIQKEHPKQEGEERHAKKILALLVELGELANELPEVFKFWSNKKNNYEKALKEYVDCLHFILSICIDLNEKDVQKNHFQFTTIEEHFIYVSALTSDLLFGGESTSSRSIIHFLVPAFIELGEMLGFTWEQVEQAYISKNEVNHSRQENGY